jgi:hypothetical protein
VRGRAARSARPRSRARPRVEPLDSFAHLRRAPPACVASASLRAGLRTAASQRVTRASPGGCESGEQRDGRRRRRPARGPGSRRAQRASTPPDRPATSSRGKAALVLRSRAHAISSSSGPAGKRGSTRRRPHDAGHPSARRRQSERARLAVLAGARAMQRPRAQAGARAGQGGVHRSAWRRAPGALARASRHRAARPREGAPCPSRTRGNQRSRARVLEVLERERTEPLAVARGGPATASARAQRRAPLRRPEPWRVERALARGSCSAGPPSAPAASKAPAPVAGDPAPFQERERPARSSPRARAPRHAVISAPDPRCRDPGRSRGGRPGRSARRDRSGRPRRRLPEGEAHVFSRARRPCSRNRTAALVARLPPRRCGGRRPDRAPAAAPGASASRSSALRPACTPPAQREALAHPVQLRNPACRPG